MDNIIRRIPGEIPPQPKESKQGFIDDLSKKEKFELVDLLARQNKLLSNKQLISKLPDKGEKINDLKLKIEIELKRRDEIESTAQLLSRLNIASEGKAAMSKLEWTGKYNPDESTEKVAVLDSDDEEDPLKIIAQPTGTGSHKKKIVHLPPEPSLIKSEDLEELESDKCTENTIPLNEKDLLKKQSASTDYDQKNISNNAEKSATRLRSEDLEELESFNPLEVKHLNYIVAKVENPENTKHREPFKPYKTTKSNVHDPIKEKLRGGKKDLSAATPPAIIHNPAIVIDLKESLKLQQQQAEKLQEVQAKHAAERLVEKLGMYKLGNVPEKLGNYRDKIENSSGSSDDEKYDEVHDDDDEDLQGTVTYSVDTIES